MSWQALLLLLIIVGGIAAVLWWPKPKPAGDDPGDGAASSPPPPLDGAIAVVQLDPGPLAVRIFSHVIKTMAGPLPCWTYVTDGLLALGHREISLTIKREPDEEERTIFRPVLEIFSLIRAYAARKHFVNEGGYSGLDPAKSGLLRDDFRAILYTAPQPLDGVNVPGPYLTAILLTSRELEVVNRFGHLRVSALLGEKYRFYPTAPWVDRQREEITSLEKMSEGILAKFPVNYCPGVSARMEAARGAGGDVVLRLSRAVAKRILAGIEKLRPDSALILAMDLDPEADACFVWAPGAKEPKAISKPGGTGSRISGNFVVFVPEQERDRVRLVEDGFTVSLTNETWQKLKEAFASGDALQFDGGDDMGFAISWIEEPSADLLN